MTDKRLTARWLAALFSLTLVIGHLGLTTGCDRLEELADILDLEDFDDDDDDFDFDDLEDEFEDLFDD